MQSVTPEHTITALCQRSDAISREKGWVQESDARPYHTATILFHSEISEALEEYRSNKALNLTYPGEGGKPEGIPIELADLVIRICQRMGTDGDAAVLDAQTLEHMGKFVSSPKDFSKLSFEEFLSDLHVAVSISAQCYDVRKKTHIFYLGRALAECFLFCEDNGVSIWEAIDMKEAFNRTRPHRHGGKRI